MTFEKALEAMKQGKKVRRKNFSNNKIYLFIKDGKILMHNPEFMIAIHRPSMFDTISILADDWEIYEEPQEEPEMTAEKATAILESIRGSECAYLIQHFEKAIDFAISAIKDNETYKEVNDVLSKSLEKKNKCLCECADKTEAFKHGTYFRALE